MKERYLQALLGQIHGKKLRESLRAEMNDHIEDALAHYLDMGYDAEEALLAALEEMGEPEALGRELNALYHPGPGRFALPALSVLLLGLLAVGGPACLLDFVFLLALPLLAALLLRLPALRQGRNGLPRSFLGAGALLAIASLVERILFSGWQAEYLWLALLPLFYGLAAYSLTAQIQKGGLPA